MGRNLRIRIRTWTMMKGGGYEEVDGVEEKSNIFGFEGTDSSGGVPETGDCPQLSRKPKTSFRGRFGTKNT